MFREIRPVRSCECRCVCSKITE